MASVGYSALIIVFWNQVPMFSCASYFARPATAGQQQPTDKAPAPGLASPGTSAWSPRAAPDSGSTGINHRKTTLSSAAVSYHQRARPNWLRFLANAQTIQEQLLELMTPGEIVPSLLNDFPPRAREPLMNQFPGLRQRWNKPELLTSDSPAARHFLQFCHGTGKLESPDGLIRTIEADFIWQESLKPMTGDKLARRMRQHANNLLSRLLTGPGLFNSRLETIASVCQFLAGHGVHPAIVHQLKSPSGRSRNIMIIPAQDGAFLITHFTPHFRHYVSDYDAMVLSHAGIPCREFTTCHMRGFTAKLIAILQLNTHPELMQTYHGEALSKRLEYYDTEHASELLSRVTFLMSAKTEGLIDGAHARDLDLVKLILSTPSDTSIEEDEYEGIVLE